MIESTLLFLCLLFLVAFFYASVGHGGASGYLALMALFSFTPAVMKPTALLLNIFVSVTSFLFYYRAKHFQWKLFYPFAITSIPMAFVGGMITVDALIYKKILGVLLIIPVLRFLFFRNISVEEIKKSNVWLSLIIGAAIGFFSGMIGIGGGIILSPVLLLLKWTDMKQAAAVSALFIFVNSLSGFAGQLTKGIHFSGDMLAYVLIALLGGALGAYYGAQRFNQGILKNLLAVVLLVAAYKLIFLMT